MMQTRTRVPVFANFQHFLEVLPCINAVKLGALPPRRCRADS